MNKIDSGTIYFIVLVIGVLMGIYYFLDATYWNPQNYGPGNFEEQGSYLQDEGEFYAP